LYDARPLIPAGEGQGSEGGADQFENCVFAWAGVVGIIYCGADPFEPQDFRDLTTPGYHGGEYFQTAIDFMESHRDRYPGLPSMVVEGPGDLQSAIRAHAALNWLMGIGVKCYSNATIAADGPYGHCAGIAAVRDDGVTLWGEGFYGGYVDMSWAELDSVYGGGLWVCQAPIPGLAQAAPPPQEVEMLTMSQKREYVQGAYLDMNREPESVEALDGWANTIHDNADNVWEVCTQIRDSGEGQAWRARVQHAVETVEAGGVSQHTPQAAGVPPHTHQLTATTGGAQK